MRKLITAGLLATVTAGSLLVTTEAAQATASSGRAPSAPGKFKAGNTNASRIRTTSYTITRRVTPRVVADAARAYGDGTFNIKITNRETNAVTYIPATVQAGRLNFVHPENGNVVFGSDALEGFVENHYMAQPHFFSLVYR